jgi:hypothetical protein
MSASYTKLRDGSWGLRVVGASPHAGATVVVRTRAGATKTETVGRVLWSGQGVHLASIQAGASRGTSSSYRGYSRARRTGCSCGSLEDTPRDSDCASCQHDY